MSAEIYDKEMSLKLNNYKTVLEELKKQYKNDHNMLKLIEIISLHNDIIYNMVYPEKA